MSAFPITEYDPLFAKSVVERHKELIRRGFTKVRCRNCVEGWLNSDPDEYTPTRCPKCRGFTGWYNDPDGKPTGYAAHDYVAVEVDLPPMPVGLDEILQRMARNGITAPAMHRMKP